MGRIIAKEPFPCPIFCDVSVVSGSATTHSSDIQVLYQVGYAYCGTYLLPAFPCSQPLGLLLFAQINLSAGLHVRLVPCFLAFL